MELLFYQSMVDINGSLMVQYFKVTSKMQLQGQACGMTEFSQSLYRFGGNRHEK